MRAFARACGVLIVLVSVCAGVASGSNGGSALPAERAFGDRMDQVVEASIQRWKRIDEVAVSRLFDQFLMEVGWTGDARSMSGPQMDATYRVADSMTVAAPSLAGRVADVFDVISARGIDGGVEAVAGDEAERAYGRLVDARMFAAARAFARRHQLAEPEWVKGVPTVDSRAAAYLDFRAVGGGSVASVEQVDLHEGTWLIAEVHPDCGFSRQAMTYLADNSAVLAGIDPGRVVWLVSQTHGQAIASIRNWNESRPGFRMVLSYRNRDWPEAISFLEFPVFNLVKEGQVVAKVRGWPGDSQGKVLADVIGRP